jgi:hypothetical protein
MRSERSSEGHLHRYFDIYKKKYHFRTLSQSSMKKARTFEHYRRTVEAASPNILRLKNTVTIMKNREKKIALYGV